MTDEPLRILLVGDYADDPRLGSGKVSHKLREEFTALGHQCDTLFGSALGGAPKNRQVRQLVAPWLAGRAIAKALAANRYDVVDVSSAEGLWFGVQKRAGHHRTTAYICRSHGLEHLNYQRMLDDARAGLTRKPWTRRIWYPASRLSQVAAAARLADRFIVLNAVDREFARARGWLPADRVELVPHGVSSRFLSGVSNPRRGAGALFCGSWDHVKGVSVLVDAWTALHETGSAVPLTILGPGVPAAQVLESFPASIRPHVTVIERVPEDRVIDEYRRHDLMVFPSTYEGFGLVVLEAMSQGLPVVATPAGCAAELIVDGVNGLRVPPRNGSAIAAAVRVLAGDEALRHRLGDMARQTAQSMSWQATARKTLDVYRRALATTR
jgi:glycosyltransferase involved in cell wall biosynthesis